MDEKIRIIIDTDPGVDDAAALMYAFGMDIFEIPLICSAGGNSPIDKITENVIHILELFKKEIPVARGPEKPLEREAVYAKKAQGKSGLGGYDFNRKKLQHKPVDGESCDVIYKTLMTDKKKTTLVCLGPITTYAKLIKKHPDCLKYVEQIVFMGGTKEKIVDDPYREFNVAYDPEASKIVLESGIKLVMVPMELGHIAYLDKSEIKRFKRANKIGKTYAKMFKNYKDHHVGHLGAAVHDTCVFYYLAHPDLVVTEDARLEIKYYKKGDLTFGFIENDLKGKPNAKICMDLNIDHFKMEIFDILEHRFDHLLK